jgi:hypothetical protein
MATAEKVKYRVHHHREMETISLPTAEEGVRVTIEQFAPCGGWTQVDILDENDEVVKSGIARCHPEDNYSRSIGRDIALGRALKESPEEGETITVPGIGEVRFNTRGFKQMPEIITSYGAKVRIYESSAAEVSHIWLRVEETEATRSEHGAATAHVDFHMIDQIIAQLRWLKKHHYHHEYYGGAVS